MKIFSPKEVIEDGKSKNSEETGGQEVGSALDGERQERQVLTSAGNDFLPDRGVQPPSVFVGIDNGVSGAVAWLWPGGKVRVLGTPVRKAGADIRIDAAVLTRYFSPDTACFHVVYEQGQKQPKFGVKGNFANGRSDGVLETVLELLRVPYRPVNPKDWQRDVFQGIRGAADNTKTAALEFCRRTFPEVDLRRTPRCAGPDHNFADALCMAWWARHFAFRE